jgi:hypothetical protein
MMRRQLQHQAQHTQTEQHTAQLQAQHSTNSAAQHQQQSLFFRGLFEVFNSFP